MFRTVSESAQGALKGVQSEAPKAWRGFATNTRKAFHDVHIEAPKVFKAAGERTEKIFNDVQAGIKRTVDGVPVPKAFAETTEDLADLTRLQIGSSGIRSRCAALPLDSCFSELNDDTPAYIAWSTPISRVTLYAKWCRVCQLILSMLCRRGHDPLLISEVRDSIEPEFLPGVSLQTWVSEGYIHQDEYRPFGRNKYRYEDATQVLGPFAEDLLELAKQYSSIGIKLLTRAALGRRPQLKF